MTTNKLPSGRRVPFHEHEINTVYVPGNKYFKNQEIISIYEFVQETKIPTEAVDEVQFWAAFKEAVRPVFKGSILTGVALNMDKKKEITEL